MTRHGAPAIREYPLPVATFGAALLWLVLDLGGRTGAEGPAVRPPHRCRCQQWYSALEQQLRYTNGGEWHAKPDSS
jgi:hypothetical protein